MKHKYEISSQQMAAKLAEEIAALWEKAIGAIVYQSGNDSSLESIKSRGKFLCYRDGKREFKWDGKTMLVGGWIEGDMSNGYEIKPVI